MLYFSHSIQPIPIIVVTSFPINVVDLIVLAVFARCLFIGNKSDIITEFFGLMGVYFATCIAIHYYVLFGSFLTEKFSTPEPLSELVAFLLLAIFVTFSFALARKGWQVLLDFDIPKDIDRWISLALSAFRGLLIIGLVILVFLLTGLEVEKITRKSLSAQVFKGISISLYKGFYSGFIHTLFPKESFNKQVLDLVMGESKEKASPP